jgi:ABC-type antimicrobial peptide transport system permease subunit
MGTDQLGRCIFSRLIFGVRTSLATAVAATVLMVLIARGGHFNCALTRVVDKKFGPLIYCLP